MITNKIQEFYIHLFLINHFVVFQKFHQQIPSLHLKTFNPEFSYTEMWFTDQNSQALEIKDRINVTSVLK